MESTRETRARWAKEMYAEIGEAMATLHNDVRTMRRTADALMSDPNADAEQHDEAIAWEDAAILVDKAIGLLDEASAAIPPRG